MSLNIWTQCGASSNVRALPAGLGHRVVESQTITSTRKLVDTDAEQALLEEMLEGVKPSPPRGPSFSNLHYLLTTPFRHPPLRHGSRFGTRPERGIWYGSLELPCALAEVAYYRLVFLEGTKADLGPLFVELTSFAVPFRIRRGVDLRASAFAEHKKALTSKTDYGATQAIGKEMRTAGVVGFFFTSARDPNAGTNVGLFEPAFTARQPRTLQAWTSATTKDLVEFKRKDLLKPPLRYSFARSLFLARGRLPVPST